MKITATSITQDYLSRTEEVHVNQQEFMDGPGRFAVGAQFEIVNLFFNPPPGVTFEPRAYSKQEIADRLGLDGYGWVMKQRDFQDDVDDYGERAYIWNSQSYKIIDEAQFVVAPDGEKSITDFGIEYWATTDRDGNLVYENFDFDSSDWAAIAGNALRLKPCIDPNNDGRKVIIKFDGPVNTRTYKIEDLEADREKMQGWKGLEPIKILKDVAAVRDQVIREASIPHCLSDDKKRSETSRDVACDGAGTMMQCMSDGLHTTALTWRDPNLRTFDRLSYDFQAPGEYTLVEGKGVNDTFVVQGRHRLLNPRVSVVDAVATKLGDAKVMIAAPRVKTPATPGSSDSTNPPNPTDPFDISGLTLLEGTSGNDSFNAQSGVPTLLNGKADSGTVQFSPTTGNITLEYSQSNVGNPFGYYTTDSNGKPIAGKIIWANPNTTPVGTSYTFNPSVTNQPGYFLMQNNSNFLN